MFHSQKFSPVELNYRITDKELLAIIDAFKQWRVYLEEAKHCIKVLIDYKNLTIFIITKVLNQQQIRWSEELSLYYFKISYRKGSENIATDTLSRRPDYFIEK